MIYFITTIALVAIATAFIYFAAKQALKAEETRVKELVKQRYYGPQINDYTEGFASYGWWLCGLGLLIILGLINILGMPALDFNKPAIYLEVLLILGVCMAAPQPRKFRIINTTALALVTIAVLGGWIMSWDIIHHKEQYKLLDVVEATDSTTLSVYPIPVEKMVTINSTVAKELVKQKLGELQNKVEIGEFTKQALTAKFQIKDISGKKYNLDFDNQIVYVAPLEHSGFLRWWRNETTSGYALVNASDASQYYIVTEVNGEKLNLRYLESGRWRDYVKRVVRNNYPNYRLDDWGVELDENGRPFNAISRLEPQFGFGTNMCVGTILVDIQTGEMTEYGIEDTPAWVNRVIPGDVALEMVHYWGEYAQAWFLPSQDGRKKATNMSLVYDKDGCSFYVGIQAKPRANPEGSESNNKSTSGYMLINTRNGKATYYSRDGITEETACTAMAAHQSIAQDIKLGTVALDDAVFYNVDGLPTYFSPFVSTQDNMPKYYGFCCADNKEIVGVARSLQEAKAEYIKSYYAYKQKTGLHSNTATDIITMVVTVAEKVQENNVYYFRFAEIGDKVFFAYSDLLPNVRWKAERVRISFKESKDAQIVLTAFEKEN